MSTIRVLSLFLFFIFPMGFAAAQDIPLPLLESDRKSCHASCIGSYSGQQCTQLCDCTVTAFKKQVNFDLYLQMISQISQNNLSRDNSRLMDAIAVECSSSIYDKRPMLADVSTDTTYRP